MSTDTFRRHTRVCVDRATHLAFASLPKHSRRRALFERLLVVARARSNLLTDVAQVDVLSGFVDFANELVRDPDTWNGARGHPLFVVDSLARHLFGRYPMPRFLASVWFGARTSARVRRRRWFVAHARGQRFRSLDLPIVMTRRMEHVFLRTPDHVPIDHALRRAQVLGLGGSPALLDAVLASRLAVQFGDPNRWHDALTWLVRYGDALDLGQLGPLVDYLQANLHTIELRGRSFASVMHLAREWHARLASPSGPLVRWRRSRWNELVMPVERMGDWRRAQWTIVELLDSRELAIEGHRMRHCVASYTTRCAFGRSAIWSLRRRWCDDGTTRSSLTIEVRRDTSKIVQLRGYRNARPTLWQLELVRRWAAREGLSVTD
jgi:hypothetical protein